MKKIQGDFKDRVNIVCNSELKKILFLESKKTGLPVCNIIHRFLITLAEVRGYDVEEMVKVNRGYELRAKRRNKWREITHIENAIRRVHNLIHRYQANNMEFPVVEIQDIMCCELEEIKEKICPQYILSHKKILSQWELCINDIVKCKNYCHYLRMIEPNHYMSRFTASREWDDDERR